MNVTRNSQDVTLEHGVNAGKVVSVRRAKPSEKGKLLSVLPNNPNAGMTIMFVVNTSQWGIVSGEDMQDANGKTVKTKVTLNGCNLEYVDAIDIRDLSNIAAVALKEDSVDSEGDEKN